MRARACAWLPSPVSGERLAIYQSYLTSGPVVKPVKSQGAAHAAEWYTLPTRPLGSAGRLVYLSTGPCHESVLQWPRVQAIFCIDCWSREPSVLRKPACSCDPDAVGNGRDTFPAMSFLRSVPQCQWLGQRKCGARHAKPPPSGSKASPHPTEGTAVMSSTNSSKPRAPSPSVSNSSMVASTTFHSLSSGSPRVLVSCNWR